MRYTGAYNIDGISKLCLSYVFCRKELLQTSVHNCSVICYKCNSNKFEKQGDILFRFVTDGLNT